MKTTDSGGPLGFGFTKKILGFKRHVMIGTDDRALGLLIRPAGVQDRDGAVPLLKASRSRHPFVANTTSIDIQIGRKMLASPVSSSTRVAGRSLPRRFRVRSTWKAGAGRGRARAHLCLAWPKPPARQELRGDDHLGDGLALRRLRHAPQTAAGTLRMNSDTAFETR
ncbi:hypothetical protein FOY91_04910 [Sphingomonas solaris]|uniref:Transposase n=1 Tax=Alterirhizorhabdus solaris TaxID=2529389 RepID=A0A558RA61_9SPHN|nr:hypothetical protein FOY91_04910 [Sphingomonas solaris]